MSIKPITTRIPNENEIFMRQKFYESITAQSDLMDKLGERLLTLELAIPGLYATVAKLIIGNKVTVFDKAEFYITFVCWLLALILTLIALIPRKWIVDPAILKQSPDKIKDVLGIEDFFKKSAQYKQRLMIISSILFFVGIFSAALTIG